MSNHYYIKRNGKVKGPFSIKKIQELVEAKKLKVKDELSETKNGPWRFLNDSYQSIYPESSVITEHASKGSNEDVIEAIAVSDEPEANLVENTTSYSNYRKRSNWGIPVSLILLGCGLLTIVIGGWFFSLKKDLTTASIDLPDPKNVDTPKVELVKSDVKRFDVSSLSGIYDIGNRLRANAATRDLQVKHLIESQKSGFNVYQQALEAVELFHKEGFIKCEIIISRLDDSQGTTNLKCIIQSVEEMTPGPAKDTRSEAGKALQKVKALLIGGVLIVEMNIAESSSFNEIQEALQSKLSKMYVSDIKIQSKP